MNLSGSLLFLGTGGSMGIPVIGCHCEVCQSDLPENKRSRPCALVKVNNKTLLIDAGQEYRTQALKYKINQLDGVIFTHAHHDHTAGIDDLRVYYMLSKKELPCLFSKETEEDLRVRYAYIFHGSNHPEKLTTRIITQRMEGERGSTNFAGIPIQYMSYHQAGMKVNGIRIGNMAYVSDIRDFPETIFEDLKGVETLIISALRHDNSQIHFTVDEAVAFSKKVGATKTWFTHIAHELDHKKTNAYLPSNIRLAYDGLEIQF